MRDIIPPDKSNNKASNRRQEQAEQLGLEAVAASDVPLPTTNKIAIHHKIYSYIHSLSKKTRLIVLGSTAALLVIAGILSYLAYFSSLELGQTSLAGVVLKPSMTDSQAQKIITSKAANYRFSLASKDAKPTSYKLADAGIQIDAARSVTDAKINVRNLGWERFAWWRDHDLPLVAVTDHKKFDAFVSAHVAVADHAAINASISATSGQAVITDSSDGWTYAVPGGNQGIVAAAEKLRPLQVTLAKTTIKPAIARPALVSAQQKITAYLGHNVSFSLDDKTYAPTSKDIGAWLDIEPVPAHKTVDVSVNSGKVQAYLDKVTKNDVLPARSQVTTTDASGVVSILTAGQNGTSITNEATVVKSVTDQMQQLNPVIHADLAAAHQNFSTINAADYPKWILADVTTKRMYAYEHSTLVRTFLVSAGAPKTPTVLGTYQIFNKVAVKTMRGANADGSRYVQPNVRYVNYFYRDYAIHGNYWRPASYFGNINSSHGCVGIPNSDAQWLYDWAPIGTTVITHA